MQVYIICRLCTVFCILCSQLVLNCIHGKADEALSFWFLLQWFAGDSTNLVGALLTHQLTTQVSTILSAVFCSYSHQTCFCMVAAIPIKHVSVLWQLFPSNMFLYCGSYSHQTCFCIVAAIPTKHVSVLWQLFPSNMYLYCGSYLNNMQVFHVTVHVAHFYSHYCTENNAAFSMLYVLTGS